MLQVPTFELGEGGRGWTSLCPCSLYIHGILLSGAAAQTLNNIALTLHKGVKTLKPPAAKKAIHVHLTPFCLFTTHT